VSSSHRYFSRRLQHLRFVCRPAVSLPLLAGLVLGCESPNPAQSHWYEARDSTGFRSLRESPSVCRDCIALNRVAVLGDTSGPGYIEWTQSFTRDSLGNYWAGQGDGIKVFDSAGRYLRQVGRAGQGPMEFRYIFWIHTDDDGRVHIVDLGNVRETIVGADFELHAERPIPGSFGSGSYPALAPLPGTGRYALNMYHVVSGQVGLPLHIADGAGILHSFGDAIDEGSPQLNQNKARRMLTTDSSGRIFSAQVFSYAVEAWTDIGERITGFEGPKLNEKEPAMGAMSADNPPPKTIAAIQVDEQQRLWVIVFQAKDDWLDRMVERPGPRGRAMLVPKEDDPRFLYTIRIDVIDLNTASIIASSEREELVQGFVGNRLGLEFQYTETGIPRAVVWSLALEEPGRE
jgi:hypothetical protein